MSAYFYDGHVYSPDDSILCTLSDDEFTEMAGTVIGVRSGGCVLSMANDKRLALNATRINIMHSGAALCSVQDQYISEAFLWASSLASNWRTVLGNSQVAYFGVS